MNIIEKFKNWKHNIEHQKELKKREKELEDQQVLNDAYAAFNEVHSLLTESTFTEATYEEAKIKITEAYGKMTFAKNYFRYENEDKKKNIRKRFLSISISVFAISIALAFINFIAFLIAYVIGRLVLKKLMEDTNAQLKGIEEIDKKLEEIEKIYQNKSDLLNRKAIKLVIAQKVPSVTNDRLTNVCIYANEIIANYIDGFDLNVDDIDSETKLVMLQILQIELKTEEEDLPTLLQLAKEKANKNITTRGRKKDN